MQKLELSSLPKTAEEGRLQGSLFYFTGKPCKHGHFDVRYTKDRCCKTCGLKKKTKLYIKHADKIRAKRREKYAKNPEPEKATARIRSAGWRENNPNHEGAKASKRKYKINNPGKATSDLAKRRASKMQRTACWADHEKIKAYYDVCSFFNKVNGYIKYHVDHEIPLQGKLVSGLHVHNNLRVIPWEENVKKANRFAV